MRPLSEGALELVRHQGGIPIVVAIALTLAAVLTVVTVVPVVFFLFVFGAIAP